MYTNMTKHAGLLHDTTTAAPENTIEHETPTDNLDGASEAAEASDDVGASYKVMSTGRQRFGDTRTMKFFALSDPMLVEYMQ